MSLFSPYEPARRGGAPLEVELREARPEDVEALTELAVAREGRPAWELRSGFELETSGRLGRETSRLFVALHAGDAVGFARSRLLRGRALGPAGPRRPPAGWYLAGVIVRDELRRRGVGRRLTAHRIEDLRGEARELYYFVDARNRASIDLHRAFGFEELTRDFDPPGAGFEGGEGALFRLTLA